MTTRHESVTLISRRLQRAEAEISQAEERSRQLQRELTDQREFLNTLINALPDMIFAKDEQLRLVLVNDEYCRKTGVDRDDILGGTVYDTYPREIADVYQEKDEEVMRTGSPVRNEEWIVSRTGERALIDTIKVPYRDTDGRVVGIMAVSRDITERKEIEREREQLIAQLSEALEIIGTQQNELEKTNARLARLARIDDATGVWNRRHFRQQIAVEWKRASRDQRPLTLMLADIDYFKAFNDRYGHLAGDTCLRRVAQALHHALDRASDTVARYGGEEFIAMLPDTEDLLMVVAERWRRVVHDLRIPHETSPVADTVTVSVGAANCVPDASLSEDALVMAADRALYEAKSAGRNTVRLGSV